MKNLPVVGLRPMMILALSAVTLVGCATYDHRDLKGLGDNVTKAESRLGSAVFVYDKCPSKTENAEIENIRETLNVSSMQKSASALISVGAAIGAKFAVNAISKGLEEQKKGLMGEFIANRSIKGLAGKLEAEGCLVVTRGLFGTPPNDGKGRFSEEWLEKLGLSDHPAFYWEARIKKEYDAITLEPVYLNYAASSARNCGSGKKNVSLVVAMSRSKSAPTKNGEIQEDKAFAVFRHNLGRLEIGKYYEGEEIFTGTSYSQTSEEFSKEEPFNITVKVAESEEPGIALEALTEAFNDKKGDLQKAFEDLLKKDGVQ